ncbi:MAG: hypothetical protein L0Y62_03010, partial [Nitrospirae bacterium]|nr:hypothetical protein [Nitrospirota bacterium]
MKGNKKKYYVLGAILFLIFVLPNMALSLVSVSSGPVDFTLEPVLSGEWASHIEDGRLYIRTIDKRHLKVRDAKSSSGTILSPVVSSSRDSVFVTWVEKGSGGSGNKIMFVSSSDNGKSIEKNIEITGSSKTHQVRLLLGSDDSIYIIETGHGADSSIFVNILSSKDAAFRRIQLDAGLENLQNSSAALTKDKLYIFISGVKEGRQQVGVKTIS